jgi:predicted amidohydrolase YtcJ
MRQVVAVDDEQRRFGWVWHAANLFKASQIALGAMQADLLLKGGTLYTQDRRQPRAGALAVARGRIVATAPGVDALNELVGPSTRVIEAHGSAVVPGFVDAHVHFGHWALAQQQVDLDAALTLDDGLAVLRNAAVALRQDAWVQGRGWDRNRWGRLPTGAELETAVGGRAAALSSHDGHSLWLSTTALRAAGIGHDTPDPPGGVIERDSAGEPTGVLFENAQDLARAHIPEPEDADLVAALGAGLRRAAAAGLTGIHNLEDARTRRAFAALEAAGDLTLRVYHGVSRGELNQARERGLSTGAGSDWLRVGPVKLFADGALGSRTAWLLEPYVGQADNGYRGVATLTAEELEAAMRLAAEAGLDVAVHAIGDAAVRGVLDAFERTRAAFPPLAQRMLRIEHAQLVHPDDVPRFASLGAVASMQPIHAIADWRVADRHWGERARFGYAWRSLQKAGARLAFGTDAPVESIEPLKSLYAAMARVDANGEPSGGWYAEERLTLPEAVRAYTLGSAAAERAQGRRGMLAAGMDADLVVLRPDPFERPAEGLLETRVALTLVGGRITFSGAYEGA